MPTEVTKLSEEFVKYQLLQHKDIPASVWKEALVVTDEDESNRHYRMDVRIYVIWGHLTLMKCANGNQNLAGSQRLSSWCNVLHIQIPKKRGYSLW